MGAGGISISPLNVSFNGIDLLINHRCWHNITLAVNATLNIHIKEIG